MWDGSYEHWWNVTHFSHCDIFWRIEFTEECATSISAWRCYFIERITSEGRVQIRLLRHFYTFISPKRSKRRKSNVRRNCCVAAIRKHNLCVKDAPCLSLRGKEGQKAESEETGKGWRKIKRVLWKEVLVHVLLREQNTSFICCSPGDTFASSSTLEYENSHLTPRLPSPHHSSTLSSFFNSPPHPLWSALHPHPPTHPTPESTHTLPFLLSPSSHPLPSAFSD